jgi:hypothetical protein
MKNMPVFSIGDTVTWVSKSKGYTRRKIGVVVVVVAPHENPGEVWCKTGLRKCTPYFGTSRRHQSYMIDVDGVAYWPRVSQLKYANKAEVRQ